MPHQDRLNIAVFIDFDNIEIGVKNTLGQQFDVGTILDAIKERGEVVTKIAYADWTRAGEYSRSLTQHAIRLVQRNLTPGGDKNGADINLALDALEMAFTHPHINAYVIVGGDSDFLSLVEKLKQYDKKVFVVGGRAFTSVILQRNCHEFIAYENLAGVRKPPVKGERPVAATAVSPVAQAFPIVRRALKILADREVSPQTGLLKSTLLQLDSTFSERTYGASSFLDFVEKLSHSGLVHLKHAGRSVMVELNDRFEDGDTSAADPKARAPIGSDAPTDHAASVQPPDQSGVVRGSESGVVQAINQPGVVQAFRPARDTQTPVAEAFRPAQERPAYERLAAERPAEEGPPPVATEPAADGVKLVGELLVAATGARWPMYLRNVKQILRAAVSGFDERRYGFSGLVELMRACQKEGLIRLERDRRGGLRVFQGPVLQRPAVPREETADLSQPQPVETVPIEAVGEVYDTSETGEPELVETEPMPTVDPTAELLGTAKRKRATRAVPHSSTSSGPERGGRSSLGSGQKKGAARKAPTATRRTTRSKKTTDAIE